MLRCEVIFSDVTSGKSSHFILFYFLRKITHFILYYFIHVFCCFIGYFFHKSDIAFIQLLFGYFIWLIPIAYVSFKRIVWEQVQVYRKIEWKS